MSKAARGPETARVSRPTLATFGFPMTGAASSVVPRGLSASRTCCETSVEMVEQSTRMAGAAWPDISPSGPSTAAIRSCGVPTVANTMSTSARSAAEPTTFAPSAASGSALARVRL